MTGHSDLGIFQQFVSIFPFYLGVYTPDTASAACPSQPGNLETISMILAAVIETLKILDQ